MFDICKEIFYDTYIKGSDERGKYRELEVTFSDDFEGRLLQELNIKGHIIRGNIKIYYPKGDLDIDIIYEEGTSGDTLKKQDKLDFDKLSRETKCILIAGTVKAFKDTPG